MHKNLYFSLTKLANACEALAIVGILLLALILQFTLHELPCPLCLLQRIGFYFILYGFLLNIRFGFKPFHYSLAILGGLFTTFVSLRQIALHIIPGTGAYGSPIFGFHLYTWTFIITVLIIVVTTLLAGVDRQYTITYSQKRNLTFTTPLLFTLICVSLIINIAAVFIQCGLAACPDNPVRYKFSIPK